MRQEDPSGYPTRKRKPRGRVAVVPVGTVVMVNLNWGRESTGTVVGHGEPVKGAKVWKYRYDGKKMMFEHAVHMSDSGRVTSLPGAWFVKDMPDPKVPGLYWRAR